MQEQRATTRLTNYWEILRKDKPFPDIRHFNSATVEDIWPFCLQISISGQAHPVYKYEYMGGPVAEVYGGDLTGMTVDHRVMEFPGSVIHKRLDDVVKTRSLLKDEGHLINREGKLVKYRACFLPFGNDAITLSHIVAGLTWRIY